MFTLLTCVRPIKVGILNRFLRVVDDGLPTVLIKKKLKKMILKVPFLPLKIAFYGFLEMLKIFVHGYKK